MLLQKLFQCIQEAIHSVGICIITHEADTDDLSSQITQATADLDLILFEKSCSQHGVIRAFGNDNRISPYPRADSFSSISF